MHKNRLEAFSDGVLAIIITIMVLELKVPHGADFETLNSILPIFLSYLLSFVYVAIYWNNHHHMFQVVKHVNGKVLWANMHLLFWLSLIPFVTSWSGENHFLPLPVAVYGFVLCMAGVAYYILTQTLISLHGSSSHFAKALGSDLKGKLSVFFYLTALPLAFWQSFLAMAIYVIVAIIWVVPDKRMEIAFENFEK